MTTSSSDAMRRELERLIKQNEPMSYADFLADRPKPNAIATKEQGLRRATARAARADAGFGAEGELLAARGLIDSGYREYLRSLKRSDAEAAVKEATDALALARSGESSAYRDYLAAYQAEQAKRKSSVVRAMRTQKITDFESGYRLGVESGLSASNAESAAAAGVAEATRRVRDEVIRTVLNRKMSQGHAILYARELGLSESVAQQIGAFAKALRDGQVAADTLPEFYREHLKP